MRKNIPYNNVSDDYNNLLDIYINRINEFSDKNLISIFLTGSFARGEATENSDLDVWCIFNEFNTNILIKIGDISRNLPINYDKLEINSQCMTIKEFNSNFFSKYLSYPIIYFEGVLLFGDDIAKKHMQDIDVENTYKGFLAEILLSIRHYISVNEPIEKLTHHKIKTWVLKPLMFALRLERYLYKKEYPLKIDDLLLAYDNPPKSVQYFMNNEKWDYEIKINKQKTLYELHEEVIKLLN